MQGHGLHSSVLFVGDLTEVAPTCNVTVRSRVSEHKKAAICLTGKTYVLDTLCSSTSYDINE